MELGCGFSPLTPWPPGLGCQMSGRSPSCSTRLFLGFLTFSLIVKAPRGLLLLLDRAHHSVQVFFPLVIGIHIAMDSHLRRSFS